MNTADPLTSASSTSLRAILINSLVFLGIVYLILISSSVEGMLNPILLSGLLLFYLLTRSKGDLGIEISG